MIRTHFDFLVAAVARVICIIGFPLSLVAAACLGPIELTLVYIVGADAGLSVVRHDSSINSPDNVSQVDWSNPLSSTAVVV